jgi:hypothetical protein
VFEPRKAAVALEKNTLPRDRLIMPGRTDLAAGRCQSKIPNTWSGHRTAQIDPEKCREINGREIRI